MRTTAHKISIEANRIAREYIETLAQGKEPATLESWILRQQYGIMDSIGDARLNMDKTLESVRGKAHYLIKTELDNRPALAERLIRFRADQRARDDREQMERQKDWKALNLS